MGVVHEGPIWPMEYCIPPDFPLFICYFLASFLTTIFPFIFTIPSFHVSVKKHVSNWRNHKNHYHLTYQLNHGCSRAQRRRQFSHQCQAYLIIHYLRSINYYISRQKCILFSTKTHRNPNSLRKADLVLHDSRTAMLVGSTSTQCQHWRLGAGPMLGQPTPLSRFIRLELSMDLHDFMTRAM